MGKTDAHTVYKNEDGERVRSVTTIINQNLGRNKNALIGWTRKIAMSGKDPWKVRDEAADIGTLAHYMIECHINQEEPDLHEYSPKEIESAENAYQAYLDWEERYEVEPIESEIRLVTTYGGTIDMIANVQGKRAIVDFKTTSGVYTEHEIQLAAYGDLYHSHYGDEPAESVWLLHLDKVTGKFTPHEYSPEDLTPHMLIFEHLLAVDKLWDIVK